MRQYNGGAKDLHDRVHIKAGPRIVPIPAKLLPSGRRDRFCGFEERSGFIELKDVARPQVKAIAHGYGDSDLTF